MWGIGVLLFSIIRVDMKVSESHNFEGIATPLRSQVAKLNPQYPKMEMNEEKTKKFQFHFPVLLVPCLMERKLSKKNVAAQVLKSLSR